MEGFFSPRGVAVFGVSENPKNVARAVLQNLQLCRYQGHVVGIGSREYEIDGVKILPSIAAVDQPIDLAVIITPAATVIPLMQECRDRGIRRAVVMTAGFNEFKGGDDVLSKEVKAAADELGVRFIGPNCQGVINTQAGLCLPFGLFPPGSLKQGDISIITQSGTICWMGSSYLSHELGGVNKVVSLGNKLNMNEIDFLDYFMGDDSTRLILLHLEGTEKGRELFETIRQSPKPVILFKTQISQESRKVAYSHTAALADDDRVVEGACEQYGVLRARSFREMIDMAKALSLKPIRGNRLGIISASGGIGIMAADTCKREGMVLADIPDSCLEDISRIPKAKLINLSNPVDTGNIYDAMGQHRALDMVARVAEVDGAILSQFHPETGEYFENYPVEDIIRAVEELSNETDKPIAVHFLCNPQVREKMKAETGTPLFDTIEDAVAAMKYLWRYRLLLQKRARIGTRRAAAELAPAVFDPAVHPDRQGFQLLSRYEIPYEAAFFSRSEEDAVEAAATFGYPVALKAISPDFTHKSAAGAVVLGIDNEAKLREALKKMKERLAAQGAGLSDFLLQRMALPGPELFLGGKQDPHYGPVLILGHGGVKVESHDRFLTALAPVSPETAADMLTRLEGGPSIESRYFPELVRILVQFSKLLCGNPRLEEIDINPLRLLPETGEVKALDVRLLFQKG